MSLSVATIVLLIVSNIFMTLAWYGHLSLNSHGIKLAWPVVILLSWGLAFFEYCFQVPANRLGFEGNGGPFSLIQLKVIQEVITLSIFVVFSLIAFDSFKFQWNHALAFLLLIVAVYLVFMK